MSTSSMELWPGYPHIIHRAGDWYVERIDNDPGYAEGTLGHTVAIGCADTTGQLWDMRRTVGIDDHYVGPVQRSYIAEADRYNAEPERAGRMVAQNREQFTRHPASGED